MKEIRDKRNRVACKGDPTTGRLDCLYSEYAVTIPVIVGQTVVIQRDDCITFVTRTATDFTVNAMKAA